MTLTPISSRPMPQPITSELSADDRQCRFNAIVVDYFKTIAEFNIPGSDKSACQKRIQKLQSQIYEARRLYGGLDDQYRRILKAVGPIILVTGLPQAKL